MVPPQKHYWSSVHNHVSWFLRFISDNLRPCSWTTDCHFISVEECGFVNVHLPDTWNFLHLAPRWSVSILSPAWMAFTSKLQNVRCWCCHFSNNYLTIRLLRENLRSGKKGPVSRFNDWSWAWRANKSHKKRSTERKAKTKREERGFFCVHTVWVVCCVLGSINRVGKHKWILWKFLRSLQIYIHNTGFNLSASSTQPDRLFAAHGEISTGSSEDYLQMKSWFSKAFYFLNVKCYYWMPGRHF